MTFASDDRHGGDLSEIVTPTCLLVIESGAEEPMWVASARIACLDQQADESLPQLVERSAGWILQHSSVNTVVVALAISSSGSEDLEHRVSSHGERLVSALDRRAAARLLFSAPASISEPTRRRLLNLIANLAQQEKGQHACIIGAHFSASPPSSTRIPIADG